MCSKIACRNCGKATWVGCGMHVSSALRGISNEQRCSNWTKGAAYPCKGDGPGGQRGIKLAYGY